MHLMGVRLMADWHFADFDRQRYLFFSPSHSIIIPYVSRMSRGKIFFFADPLTR